MKSNRLVIIIITWLKLLSPRMELEMVLTIRIKDALLKYFLLLTVSCFRPGNS